jgi:PncC family amidohydrolase
MDTNLELQVGEKLRQYGLRLAVAESCTGGLIGHRITNIPGSSTYYMGSITAYAYEAKVRLVNVRWDTLEKHGAVSGETVSEMALGVRRALAADIGISVSGIAGPGGGTPDKPVGLVYFGLSSGAIDHGTLPNGIWSTPQQFEGDRIAIKEQAADFALRMLLDLLEGKLDNPD